MLLRQEQDVAHPGVSGCSAPLVGIGAGGLEEPHVFDAAGPLVAGEGAEGPADEHPELQGLHLRGPNVIGVGVSLIDGAEAAKIARLAARVTMALAVNGHPPRF